MQRRLEIPEGTVCLTNNLGEVFKNEYACVYPVEDSDDQEKIIQQLDLAFQFTCYSTSRLPETTEREFCDKAMDEELVSKYGNPFFIRTESGKRLIAFAFPFFRSYKWLIREVC